MKKEINGIPEDGGYMYRLNRDADYCEKKTGTYDDILDESCMGDAERRSVYESVPGIALAKKACPGSAKKGPLEDEIRQKCNEIANFLVEKNRAYGNSVGEPVSIFAKRLDKLAQMDVRIDDKISRLQKGSEYPGDDTVKDLAGYLILRMVITEMEGIR